MKEQEVGDASAFHGDKIPARADSKPIGKGVTAEIEVKYFLDQVASIPFLFAAHSFGRKAESCRSFTLPLHFQNSFKVQSHISSNHSRFNRAKAALAAIVDVHFNRGILGVSGLLLSN